MDSLKAEDHLGLVFNVASLYTPKYVPVLDSEEYSDGVLGLLSAIESFDPSTNVKFSTFAYGCIKNAIIQGWRNRHRKIRSFLCENLQEEAQEIVDENEKYVSPEDKMDLIHRLLETHPNDKDSDIRNKKVLYLHYHDGKSWAEIAEDFGVTRACAQQYGKKAISLIRSRFNLENESLVDLIFKD